MISRTLALAALALRVAAQNSTITSAASAPTAITVPIGTMTSGFAGSIISADACDTTYVVSCTDSDSDVCSSLDGISITATAGPTDYQFSYSTSVDGAQGIVSQSCALFGDTAAVTSAVCVVSASASESDSSSSTSRTITITDTDAFQYATLPITAGADKLSATDACNGSTVPKPTGSSTAQSGSDGPSSSINTPNAAVPTNIVREVYKVMIPIGAVVAGALI